MSTRDDNQSAHDWTPPETMTTPTSSTPPDAVAILREALSELLDSRIPSPMTTANQFDKDFSAWNTAKLKARDALAATTPAAIQPAGDLPPLPEQPRTMMGRNIDYSADDMREYGQLCRDTVAPAATSVTSDAVSQFQAECAAATKALKSPVAPATSSIADDAEFMDLLREWGDARERPDGISERFHFAFLALTAYIDARSPVSGQAGEAREAVSGEFPPLPELPRAEIQDGGRGFDADDMEQYAQAYVLADRGIRGKASDAEDGKRLDFIENNTVDLRCHDAPTAGGDDADVVWNVIEHHMAEPHEREIGWGNNAREAIDAARAQQQDGAA